MYMRGPCIPSARASSVTPPIRGSFFFLGGGAALHLESDAQCASLSESDAHCVRTKTNKKLVVFIVAYNK